MEKLLTYGFLLPPRGEEVDLTNLLSDPLCDNAYVMYCQSYIEQQKSLKIGKQFSNYVDKTWTWDSFEDPYTKFCIQVLGWCRVGNLIFPEKLITLTGGEEWHQDIYNFYSKHGYKFNFVTMKGPIG